MLIHAAKKWGNDRAWEYSQAGIILRENNFTLATDEQNKIYSTAGKDLLGCILAVGELYEVRLIPDLPADGFDRFFGSFGPDRVGLFLRDVRPILPVIPYIGRQRLFDVPDELLRGVVA